MFAIAAPGRAHANDEIIVTGTALPAAPGVAADATLVLPPALLADAPSGQTENMLAAIPGFQLFRRSDARSANATSQGVTLRGIGGNAAGRALVLLDGVPVTDPFAGWVPWPAIAAGSLSAVRVRTGGGTGAFSAGALSGAIELMSAGPDTRSSGLSARYGSRDGIDVDGALVGRIGGGFVAIDASHASGDGFFITAPEDRGAVDTASPYDQQSLSARAVFPVGADKELQVRGAWFQDSRQRGQRLVTSGIDGADASVRFVSRGAVPVEALAYVQARSYRATFARTAGDRSAEQPALDQFNVPATGIGAKLEARPSFGAHDLRVGADWRHASGTTNERFAFDGTRLTALREAGGRSDIFGMFLQHDWQASDALLLTASVRMDRWSLTNGRFSERSTSTDFADRSGWEPSGRAGFAFSAAPALTIRSAAYTNWRLPTLNELYRPFRVGPDATAANAALRPERTYGVDVGFDYRPLSTARLSVTGFILRADDIVSNITLARGPGVFPGTGFVFGAFRQRLNLDAVEARGIEASADLEIGRLSLFASYAFTDAEQRGSGAAAAQDGFRPPQVARNRAFASARYRIGENGHVGASIRHVSRQFEDDLERRPLDSFVHIDAGAAIPIARGFAVTLSGENLTDARIEDGIDIRGATTLARPRTMWAGIKWTG
ncbi:TonB-dependent receptor [Pacificimonas sp. WHA3]|uniref:TonB-dependent receptor n=1 Tax=Pacificimonas pallii TaxID=2827236 RepID=A0ABS6SID5_9SPHN|nr:TonB-dependent receptor [Pacificimonas pallii]MBV7257696.1 TonB-dependent receptor [Pacificimonas pallii]